MGTFLIILAVFVAVLAGVFFLLSLKYEQDKALTRLNSAQEAEFELITAENIEAVLDWQMMKAQGLVDKDHPAVARRKAEALS